MRVGSCPHCRGDIILTDQPCGHVDCPVPGFEHFLIRCSGEGCPHPDSTHVFVEANLALFAPTIDAFINGPA